MKIDFSKMTKTQQDAATEKRRMKAKAERVNSTQPLHAIYSPPDRASKAIRGASEYVARPRGVNEAMPPANDLWQRDCYDGAELRPFDGRPGAMDFKKWKSKGIGA